jgi:hypothetical protein
MRRIVALPALAIAVIGLTGCDNSVSNTITTSSDGATVYVVVEADNQAGMNLVNLTGLATVVSGKLVDGDHHAGTQICTASADDDGHSFTLTFFGANLPPGGADLLAPTCQKDIPDIFTNTTAGG